MAVVVADVVAATADATAGNLPVYASSKKGGNRMVAPLFAPNAILTYWSDEVPCICNGLHCTTTPAHFKFCISRSCELTVDLFEPSARACESGIMRLPLRFHDTPGLNAPATCRSERNSFTMLQLQIGAFSCFVQFRSNVADARKRLVPGIPMHARHRQQRLTSRLMPCMMSA